MQYGPARTVEQSMTRTERRRGRTSGAREAMPSDDGQPRRHGGDSGVGHAGDSSPAEPVSILVLALASRGSMTDQPATRPPTSTPRHPASEPAPHRPTLMTVHAHPDDETIGTGGRWRKAVEAGHRVVLVTGTRGEMGEIVVPDDGHAGEPPAAGRAPGRRARAGDGPPRRHRVGEPRLSRLRDDGPAGNHDPRSFWQADLDEATGRLVWFVRRTSPTSMTTYNEFGGYGHPDHIRTHDVAVRAFERAGDPAWYPEQLEARARGSRRGRHPSSTSQAIPASVRQKMTP